MKKRNNYSIAVGIRMSRQQMEDMMTTLDVTTNHSMTLAETVCLALGLDAIDATNKHDQKILEELSKKEPYYYVYLEFDGKYLVDLDMIRVVDAFLQKLKDGDDEEEDLTGIATDDEMIQEAYDRMDELGISMSMMRDFRKHHQVVIDRNNHSPSKAFEEDLELISLFEEKYDAIVYYILAKETTYSLMYVSRDKTKWEEERRAILDRKPLLYSVEIRRNPVLDGSFTAFEKHEDESYSVPAL